MAGPRAVVIGAGPAGLACAACLKGEGAEVRVLERRDAVGASWRGHYEGLKLHTARSRSGLPGMEMPRDWGRYPTRAQMIEYLEAYADRFGIAPRFGTEVASVRRADGGWRVGHDGGVEAADVVVVATGLNGAARRPDWPGMEGFGGRVLHSSEFRTAAPFAGQRVLVVGFGNSGGDIAVDLSAVVARVDLSVRGPVNIVPKELFGIPTTSMTLLRRLFGYRLADRITAPVLRRKLGSPADYGLPVPKKGPMAQLVEDGKVPLIDHGALAAIRAGRVTVRPGIERFEGDAVVFADGAREAYDAVVLATGYAVDLRPLLGDAPEVLDEGGRPRVTGGRTAWPGLYFASLKASPEGQLRQSGLDARAIAADAARPARA